MSTNHTTFAMGVFIQILVFAKQFSTLLFQTIKKTQTQKKRTLNKKFEIFTQLGNVTILSFIPTLNYVIVIFRKCYEIAF